MTDISMPAKGNAAPFLAAAIVLSIVAPGLGLMPAVFLTPVWIAIAGAAAVWSWHRALVGSHPDWRSAAGDFVLVLLIALTQDDQARVWQLPRVWTDCIRLTQPGVALVLVVCLIAAVAAIAQRHRMLDWRERLSLLLVPVLFNLLLSLGAGNLMNDLGGAVTFNIDLDIPWRIAIGRGMVLFAIAVLATQAARQVLFGRFIRDWRVYGLFAVASAHAALTPKIADAPAANFQGDAVQRVLHATGSAALMQAGLWALVFLLTGLLLDCLRGRPPTFAALYRHWKSGGTKGAIYGGLFLFLLLVANALLAWPAFTNAISVQPVGVMALCGAVLFPLAITIVSSADETPPFFSRLIVAYRDARSYLRGIVVGAGIAFALSVDLPASDAYTRFLAMALVGVMAYAGVDLLADAFRILTGPRKFVQPLRLYLLGAGLGAVVSGALGWYFDANQIAVVAEKFRSYTDLDYAAHGRTLAGYGVNALFSKWGFVDLGLVGGGVKLFYNESLSGVINWSLAAPLFSINFFVLDALIRRNLAPIREMLSPRGVEGLVMQTVRVLRWGLWMAPVIYSFLRLSPEASWYNQDGAVRTIAASIASIILPSGAFHDWSLTVFTGLLAYDWLRVVIWFDHMGLRVASLVNLSFLGGDRGDEAAARLVGHAARTRIVPDAIRRFGTWAPLLIPFYIPRGQDWNVAWSGAELLRNAPAMPGPVQSVAVAYMAAGGIGLAAIVWLASRGENRRTGVSTRLRETPARIGQAPDRFHLSNGLVTLDLRADGRGAIQVEGIARRGNPVDLQRRPMDPLQVRGPFLYLRDRDAGATWSIGYEPARKVGPDYCFELQGPGALRYGHSLNDIAAHVTAAPVDDAAIVRWTIRLQNAGAAPRRLALTSYQELALQETGAYMRDADFSNMHVGTCFVARPAMVISGNRLLRTRARRQQDRRMSPEAGFHAMHATRGRLSGYEDSRMRFIGDGDLQDPQAFRAGRMRVCDDEGLLHTFDPVASLTWDVELAPGEMVEIQVLDGHAPDAQTAAAIVSRLTGAAPPDARKLAALLQRHRVLEPAPMTGSWPFCFNDAESELSLTPSTPRPWAHVMANPLGYGSVVSNEGEIYSFDTNARHNGLTPYSFDSVRVGLPGQIIYVVDRQTQAIDTASAVPFRHPDADYRIIYAPGAATFRSTRGDLDLEMTTFVAHDHPADVRLLTIRNRSAHAKHFRVVPYLEMAVDENVHESLGHIEAMRDPASGALLFGNPHNDFRKGWAFAATSLAYQTSETIRTRVLGAAGRDLLCPALAQTGAIDATRKDDGRRVAAFAGEVEVPAGGSVDVTLVLGEASTRDDALRHAAALVSPVAAQKALTATRAFWSDLLGAVQIETNAPAFDRLVNRWLPYQLLASRLWARVGPNQRGGAIGYRDQLQDVLPLVFFDPAIARSQIVLHAGQQFLEGDVLKWWHPAEGGRTGLGQRTRASDPHLWLPYVLTRYIAATGDMSVLSVDAPYLEGRAVPSDTDAILVAPRPSRESGSVYDHCVRALDYTLARMGRHGLPLVGTGDWNDGIDLAGFEGRGESSWMAFFLHDNLTRFADLAVRRSDMKTAQRYRSSAEYLRAAVDKVWQNDRFVAFFDDSGRPMRPASIMSSSWPILSGAVGFERGRAALEGGLAHLERADRILLIDPPYGDDSDPYPGRIADYPQGVRENGAQYTHGASWTIDAFVRLAALAREASDASTAAHFSARAWECWRKISPLGKTEGDCLAVYGLAPHQQPADIYEGAAHGGRGGWSWYTGSAARMISSAYALLGIVMTDGNVSVGATTFEPKGDLRVRKVTIRGRVFEAP